MHQIHHRWAIFNQGQHLYRHSLAEFPFANPAMPGVTNVETAMNWILAVLYPQTKPSVATPADLPLLGNTLNDYRVVQDDGDGKAASYRWEQREGEGSPSWHKIYDMDWGSDSILSAFFNVTQDQYIIRAGRTDKNPDGTPITGLFAGQMVTGGDQTNQNLTLNANAADGTGYVQTVNHFRPTSDGSLDLGTVTERFRSGLFTDSVLVDSLSILPGQISDSNGGIDFADNNLTTTGNISGFEVEATDQFVSGTLSMSAGSITDGSGTISFGGTDLTTSGTITGNTGSILADITFTTGSIVSDSGAIDFDTNDLSTTGTLSAGNTTVSQLDSGNIRLAGNTISITNSNGNLILQANGTGIIDLQNSVTSLGITATGVVSVTGQLNADNLRLDGNVISSTNANGNIVITPNGTGAIQFSSVLQPGSDNLLDIGDSTHKVRKLFLGTSISDGSTEIVSATLQSLRDINVGVSTGMSLFYDGSKWVPSLPDTEIVHNTLSGLTTGDAGHTQFVMLTGRSGGQLIQGGTAAAELLILESTSNASKGTIQTKDHFTPFTNASFSGTWSGTDLGSSTRYFRDLYTKGELKGARLENFTFSGLPSSSAQNVGRLAWTTDQKKVYVDNGASWQVAGVAKYINDESFDGVQTTKTITVSASITDARNAMWELADNANDFERIHCTIKKISATQVQIVTDGALPAGSYRLIGLE